jgi:hypothetical protein
MNKTAGLKIVVGLLWFSSIAIAWIPSHALTYRCILWNHYGLSRVCSEGLSIVGGDGKSLIVSNGDHISTGHFRARSLLFTIFIVPLAVTTLFLEISIVRWVSPKAASSLVDCMFSTRSRRRT